VFDIIEPRRDSPGRDAPDALTCAPAPGGWVIGSEAAGHVELVTAGEAEAFAGLIRWHVGGGEESPPPARLGCRVVRPDGGMGADARACVIVRGRCFVTDGEARAFAGLLLEAAEVAGAWRPAETWQGKVNKQRGKKRRVCA
jgi:hypothetical protein